MSEKALFIQWQESYSVGHTVLDRQHRFVIDAVNELYELLRNGATPVALQDVLEHLNRYTRTHFTFEEKLLESAGYPDLDSHRLLHREMRDKSWGGSLGPESAEEIFDFLKEWWLNHILRHDMEYAGFLRGEGK